MTLGQKIYEAKQRWDCSFEEMAFLLGMDKEMVGKLYHQEKSLRSPSITLDADLTSLHMTTRTMNCLARIGVKTVRQLLTCTSNFAAIRGCGTQSFEEIVEARSQILTVLKLTVPELQAVFSSGGGCALDVEFDGEESYTKPVTRMEILRTWMEKIESISGRTKGWMKIVEARVAV